MRLEGRSERGLIARQSRRISRTGAKSSTARDEKEGRGKHRRFSPGATSEQCEERSPLPPTKTSCAGLAFSSSEPCADPSARAGGGPALPGGTDDGCRAVIAHRNPESLVRSHREGNCGPRGRSRPLKSAAVPTAILVLDGDRTTEVGRHREADRGPQRRSRSRRR
jgi:hypothetical protein